MRPLKPAAGPCLELPTGSVRPVRAPRDAVGRWLDDPRPRDPITLFFVAVWSILTFPFRVVFGVFGLVGRLMLIAIGFGLMVLGAAMTAGPLAWPGIAVFVLGLIVAMRSL